MGYPKYLDSTRNGSRLDSWPVLPAVKEIVTILATTRGICEKVNVEVLYQDSGQDGGVDRATLLTTHDHIKITEPSRNT